MQYYSKCADQFKVNGWELFNNNEEYKRWGIDLNNKNCGFRITYCNQNFDVCSSYPKELLVPSGISDEEIIECSKFRTRSRFPSKFQINNN